MSTTLLPLKRLTSSASLRATRTLKTSPIRAIHFDQTARPFQPGQVKHLPFDPTNKRAFTVKFLAYLGTGFALPWIALWWQWHRPGGLKNPDGKWPAWLP